MLRLLNLTYRLCQVRQSPRFLPDHGRTVPTHIQETHVVHCFCTSDLKIGRSRSETACSIQLYVSEWDAWIADGDIGAMPLRQSLHLRRLVLA